MTPPTYLCECCGTPIVIVWEGPYFSKCEMCREESDDDAGGESKEFNQGVPSE